MFTATVCDIAKILYFNDTIDDRDLSLEPDLYRPFILIKNVMLGSVRCHTYLHFYSRELIK
jgi:hypothetical protein